MVTDSVELADLRHHLAPGALRLGDLPADGIVVIGNREELRTAVANLLDNAVKYTGAEKDIVVDVLTPDIDTAVLRVRDNGVGIPRSELKRIFKRFYRIPMQVTSAVRGTGLGLFIVRSIVKRHGGEVIAESAGRGARQHLQHPPPQGLSPMSRILIVEDEPHLAQGLRFNLEAEGHAVEVVESGEDALQSPAEREEELRRRHPRHHACPARTASSWRASCAMPSSSFPC